MKTGILLVFLVTFSMALHANSLEKCKRGTPCFEENIQEESSSIFMFISKSVPEASWKDFSQVLEKLGGSFVLRGLPNNSFQSFAKFIQNLREKGIRAPVYIDPDAYDKFGIQTVPTLVLDNEQCFDKMVGNVPVLYSLKAFSDSGKTSELASSLLTQWEKRSKEEGLVW